MSPSPTKQVRSSLRPVIIHVTERIRERSRATRDAYLARLHKLASRPRQAEKMGCANVAHAFASMPREDKLRVLTDRAPNIGIVTAYNEMLSAHQPYERYPCLIREEARRLGATAQVAGGVPAMCDGVTQGMPGMELSLFSRDTIAMATAGRAFARRVRRGPFTGCVRQDRSGTFDRSAAFRTSAVRVRAGGSDEYRVIEQR